MASVGLPDGVLVTARSFGSPRTRLSPVPPTVSREMRSVGEPLPTGAA